MRSRLMTACVVLSALAVPGFAIAVFSSPSQVLDVLEQHSGPRRFDLVGNFSFPEESVTASWKATGAFEGRTLPTVKAKMDLAVEATAEGENMSLSLKALLYQKTLYVQLTGASENLGIPEDTIETGQWYSLPIDETAMEYKDMWQEMAMAGNEQLTEETLEQFARKLNDAIFALNTERFIGGTSYKLTLRPDFLTRAIAQLCSESLFIDCAEMEIVPEDFESDPEIAEMQSLLNQYLNVSYKVDTAPGGALQFARMYMAMNWPDMFSFAMQGETDVQGTPVYLDVPKDAKPLEETMRQWNMDTFGPWQSDDGWENEEWDTTEWENKEWNWEDDDSGNETGWEEEEKWNWEDDGEEWWDTGGVSGSCDAEPGTPEFLRLVRRGVCTPPENTRPGRGALRSLR